MCTKFHDSLFEDYKLIQQKIQNIFIRYIYTWKCSFEQIKKKKQFININLTFSHSLLSFQQINLLYSNWIAEDKWCYVMGNICFPGLQFSESIRVILNQFTNKMDWGEKPEKQKACASQSHLSYFVETLTQILTAFFLYSHH